jgi:cystathionine beta-lyase family protein involved in aluminum resistance
MHLLKYFNYISLHINQSLDWKDVRNMIEKWTANYNVDLSTKYIMYYLIDFYHCQKYSQPVELIKYITSINCKCHDNYYEEFINKSERMKMMFALLDYFKGLALFIGPLNSEMREDWDMVNQYSNVTKMLIESDRI